MAESSGAGGSCEACEEEDLRDLDGVALERRLLEEDRYGGQIWSSKARCVA